MFKDKLIKHREAMSNFIWRLLQLVSKQGVTLLIFLLSARMLPPYEFGTYNYALAIIFFLIMFGDFGISTATSKYIAEYNVTNKDKLRLVLFNSTLMILSLTLIIAIFTLLFGRAYLGGIYPYVFYLFPLIFLAPMTSLYDGIYRGVKNFKKLAIISLSTSIISLSFIYLFIKNYGLVGALVSQNLFYLILLLSLAVGYRKFSFKLDKDIIKEIGSYSFVIGMAGIGYYLFTRINVIILGHFGYITELGYYELINKVFALLLLPFTILSQVISPSITGLYSKNRNKEVVVKYKEYLIFSFVVGFVIAIFTFFTFPFILKNFLSQYYNNVTLTIMNLLLIILVTQCMSSIASFGFSTSTGHAKLNMYFLLFFGIVNIPLSILFLKLWGFMGIIYSTLIVKFLADVSFLISYYVIIKKSIVI